MTNIEKVESIIHILGKVEKTSNTLEEHQWVDWNKVLEDITKIINE